MVTTDTSDPICDQTAILWVTHQITRSGLTTATLDPATAETTRRIGQVLLRVSAVIIAYPYIPGSSSPAFRGGRCWSG